jgi:hypothetical protein
MPHTMQDPPHMSRTMEVMYRAVGRNTSDMNLALNKSLRTPEAKDPGSSKMRWRR